MKSKLMLQIASLGVLLALLPIAGAESSWQRAAGEERLRLSSPFDPLYSANSQPAEVGAVLARTVGLDQFRAISATDGAGMRVAVIDSGLDVGHPDFAAEGKVAGYRDLTNEGVVATKPAAHHRAQIVSGGVVYQVGDLPNQAAQFQLGVLELESLLSAFSGSYGVLVTASGDAGYDTVYVDTDGDLDFTDETPLTSYGTSGQFVAIANGGKTVNLLVAAIAADGKTVQFSGDFLGHGTFIAGIIAADGQYQGLAPKSALLVYKIFDHRGASGQLALASALEMALADGADVINLSLSLPAEEKVEPLLLAAIAKAEAAGVPIVAAAGNYGSALASLAFPANQDNVISAGCYIAPELQQLEMDLYLEAGYIPAYSARGPAADGSGPTVVAPGGLSGPVPLWFGEKYMYDEGTSAAAAVTAAAVSHILAYAQANEITVTPEHLETLLALSARDLGASPLEQGYGLLDMRQTVRLIDALLQGRSHQVSVTAHSPFLLPSPSSPTATITLHNNDTVAHNVRWQSSTADFVAAEAKLAPRAATEMNVALKKPTRGAQWTILSGTVDDEANPSIFLPITAITPYPAQDFTQQPLVITDTIPQGQSRHHYLQIAPQTQSLQVTLSLATMAPQNPYEHQIIMGRVKLRLYDPTGRVVSETPYFGASYGNLQKAAQTLTVSDPAAGLWQVSVISSGQLSSYNHFASEISLQIQARQ